MADTHVDLSPITDKLRDLSSELRDLSGATEDGFKTLENHQQEIENKVIGVALAVNGLTEDFHEFLAQNKRDRELQLAETRLVQVRQELEQKFGFYEEVRRSATGILQAVDADIVSLDTIRGTTEEMMITATGYWLAPVLVAISGWIRDDKGLVEKAVRESLKRDDYKTSLFFTLVSRRMNRSKADVAWMERYFAHQDPEKLDREFILVLDAIANGLFSIGVQQRVRKQIDGWLTQFEEKAGFVEEQQARWEKAMLQLAPALPGDAFPVLRQYSPTWPHLEQNLSQTERYSESIKYFQDIFSQKIAPSQRLSQELDTMLNGLVSEFDDEELPLKEQERFLQLIIDESGDRERAESRMDQEGQSFEEQVAFMDLLTNAALRPEQSGTNLATQRFAIAVSQGWILNAHETLTTLTRSEYSQEIAFDIDDWTAKTKDGSNETELLAAQQAEYDRQKKTALNQLEKDTKETLDKIKLSTAKVFMSALVGGGGILALFSQGSEVFGLILLALSGGLVGFSILANNKKRAQIQTDAPRKRAQIQADFEEKKKKGPEILSALLAEVVDYRSQWKKADGEAEEFRSIMLELTPDQYQLSRPEEGRRVLADEK